MHILSQSVTHNTRQWVPQMEQGGREGERGGKRQRKADASMDPFSAGFRREIEKRDTHVLSCDSRFLLLSPSFPCLPDIPLISSHFHSLPLRISIFFSFSFSFDYLPSLSPHLSSTCSTSNNLPHSHSCSLPSLSYLSLSERTRSATAENSGTVPGKCHSGIKFLTA